MIIWSKVFPKLKNKEKPKSDVKYLLIKRKIKRSRLNILLQKGLIYGIFGHFLDFEFISLLKKNLNYFYLNFRLIVIRKCTSQCCTPNTYTIWNIFDRKPSLGKYPSTNICWTNQAVIIFLKKSSNQTSNNLRVYIS